MTKAKSKEDEKRTVTRTLYVSDIIRKRNHDSFDSLRKEVNKAISRLREEWLEYALRKHKIKIGKHDTERELQEAFRSNNVEIVREKSEEKDVDAVYLDGKLIGEWDNARRIRVNRNGVLVVKIKYLIL